MKKLMNRVWMKHGSTIVALAVVGGIILIRSGIAMAFGTNISNEDPFYPAYNFLTNTVLGGALGTTVAMGGVGYGVYQFVKHPELGMMGTLGAGGGVALLGSLPKIVNGLGMIC